MMRAYRFSPSRRYFIILMTFFLYPALQSCAPPPPDMKKTSAPTADDHIEAGNALIASGAYENAVEQYRKALALDITASEAHGNLSVAYYHLGRYDEALREAQQAVVMAPTELNWRFNLGAAYSRKGDHERAMTVYEGAVDLARRLKDENRGILRSALIGMGRAAELAGVYSKALDAYREALVFSPDDVELMAGMGNICFRQEQYAQAEEIYARCLSLDPAHIMSRYNIGLVYAKTGRYDKAMEMFTGTPELAQKIGGGVEGSSISAVDRSRVSNITAFRSPLGKMGGPGAPRPDRAGRQPPYTYALGLTFYEKGDDNSAIEAFHRALEEEPSLAEAHVFIGNALVRQGRLEDAIAAYRDAVQVDPSMVEAYNNMGTLYAEAGQTREAMESYQKALSINDRFYDARTNLGLMLAEQGRYDEAIDEYMKVIRANVGMPEAHNNLSLIYLQQSKPDEAIKESRKAIALRGNFPEAYNNLGLALGYHVYVDRIVDTWRDIAEGWTGNTASNSTGKRAGWLLLRRIPARSSGIGGPARERYLDGVDKATRGMFREALQAFDSALAAHPEWPAARLAIAAVLLAQERWPEAVESGQLAVKLDSEDPLAPGILAIALAMNGRYGDATDIWADAVKKDRSRNRDAAQTALEQMKEQRERADRALEALQTATRLKPDFAKAYFNLGVMNDQIHRYEEAFIAYEEVSRLAPDTPIVHFRLGIACHRTGRADQARAAIQRYISLVTDPMLLPQVETFLKSIVKDKE